ncbi:MULTISPECIES: phosphoribosyl-AMP cyclohydrolase [Bacteria]|uniref:phosphoribosyl-AMP cyclohydrolase n=1 Tax=Bacteria TaxID=2 RepID=UPI003C7D20D2
MSAVADALGQVRWNDQGLVPVVVQQWDSHEVLMLAWMDEEALRRTLMTGRAVYWSRSRQSYWRKGDTSGHVQHVRGARLDCDGDTVLLQVDQIGVACHTGTRTCFEATDLHPLVGPATAAPGEEGA